MVQSNVKRQLTPCSVVGHSSGEIAAAAAAGLITSEDAIKIAYFRGQAPNQFFRDVPLGMLAVGCSAEEISKYLELVGGKVQIACYNSPSSLTLSGQKSELEKIKDLLQKDSVFSRMLLVDLAYHSTYMLGIADEYERMLVEHCTLAAPQVDQDSKDAKTTPVKMFSSVTGQLITGFPNAAYWKSNMVSPVRFAQATTELLKDPAAPNFLVEVSLDLSLLNRLFFIILQVGQYITQHVLTITNSCLSLVY